MAPLVKPIASLLIAVSVPGMLHAEEQPTPGHSMHGEAFNEGPRQFATTLAGSRNVVFPITTKNAEAQKFFEQGITQVHGFWYFEAERSFRQTAYLDPDCAMAYLGMAMANVNNEKRAAEFIKEAAKRRARVSPREQRWIDMFAAYYADLKKDEKARRDKLIADFEELLYHFPDDLEAKAFLVFQIWDNKQHGSPLGSRAAVTALAQQVLARAPMHPGIHHYLIHLWNKGGSDKRALASAARCGQSAPAIAHMWHMSGHTYSELKRYRDACWQQEASARVDHAHMAAARIMPEQIHNYAHNNDWLVKNLAYVGRVHDAIDLAKNLIEIPRLGSGKQAAWRMGRDRLLEIGLNFELWDELIALETTPFLSTDSDLTRETERLRALGLAWFSKGDRAQGDAKIAAIQKAMDQARAEDQKKAADTAKSAKPGTAAEKKTTEKSDAKGKAAKKGTDRIATMENALADLRLARALTSGNTAAARDELPKAKDIPSARLARIHLALGDFPKAEQLARDLVKADSEQVLPHALLTHVLEQAGKKPDAEAAFEQLRRRSADIDLDVPAFARLASVAERLKLPADWRMPHVEASDLGERPDLSNLGPFRWQPYRAPDFSLTDGKNQRISLSDRRGKPVLVVFYLGAGCAGCMSQLNTFAPVAKDFADAGIEIIAVSTDTPEGLDKTFAASKFEGSFPFTIASDHTLEAFRAYRAYDDFESMALHGTFLIDGTGLVRWQNISYQPFNDAKWLLNESKRLLASPAKPAAYSQSNAAK